MDDRLALPWRILLAGMLVGLAVFQTGCCSDGAPPPMVHEELAGTWIASGYGDSVWRLELRPNDTGTLCTALLEELEGHPRQQSATVTNVEFNASKGAAVITVRDSERPDVGEVLRLWGYHSGNQLWGTTQWFAPNVPGGASELEIMFVRESPLLDALKHASAAPTEHSR